jgi:hypothetical protein
MIDRRQLENLIITPSLHAINMYSDSAKTLLLYTCATESNLGTFVKQQFGGPALGIYQMEPATYQDNWINNINQRETLRQSILKAINCMIKPEADQMIWDLRLATIMARVHYSRFSEPIPEAGDFDGLVEYYHKYWAPNPAMTTIGKAKDRIQTILFGKR